MILLVLPLIFLLTLTSSLLFVNVSCTEFCYILLYQHIYICWLEAFTVFWRTAFFTVCSLQQNEPVIFSGENLNNFKSRKQQKDHGTEREKINGVWGSRNFKLKYVQIYSFLALKQLLIQYKIWSICSACFHVLETTYLWHLHIFIDQEQGGLNYFFFSKH